MSSWPWHPGYYQPNPHPHVYVPPQAYASASYWDQPAWNRPFQPEGAPTSSHRSAKYPNLNPILAVDSTLLRFDVRKKPMYDILASTYHSNRYLPAMATPIRHMRIISKVFPWTIDIKTPTPITCEMVWDAIYVALQEPIADSEWGIIIGEKKKREAIEKAGKKRQEGDQDKRFKRIDWLGDTTYFKGLEKDDEFERLRLLPGSEACSETWVLKLGS